MKFIVSSSAYIFIVLIIWFIIYIYKHRKGNNRTKNHPFPYKMFFVLGVLFGLLVPILIAIVLTFFYGNMASIAAISKIYFLFLSNLILANIYTYISKYLYKNIGNKRIEIIFSGVFAFTAMIVLNFIFLNNVFLGKTSSTDIFIILIIPVYGCVSIIVGYFLGLFLKNII